MVSQSSERVMLTMKRDFVDKIDGYCRSMGLTRSAFCVFLIAQGMFALDSTRETLDETMKSIAKNAKRTTVDMNLIDEMLSAARAQ